MPLSGGPGVGGSLGKLEERSSFCQGKGLLKPSTIIDWRIWSYYAFKPQGGGGLLSFGGKVAGKIGSDERRLRKDKADGKFYFTHKQKY